MKTMEDAYQIIAQCLSDFAQEGWKHLRLEAPILHKNLGGTTTIQRRPDGKEVDLPIGSRIFGIQDAVLFLRHDLLEKTGQRIWGLTFTLFPDGKFNIEFDYNKPEGYEETGDVITGEEINNSLRSLRGGRVER